MARIGIRSRSGEQVLTRAFELGDAYGETAELAHGVLTIALTSASWPVVADRAGTTYRIPRKRHAFVAEWAPEERVLGCGRIPASNHHAP